MNYSEIDKKWQDIWEKEKRFEVKNHEEGKENMYVLIEFPYPSGKGLHTGHVRGYTAMDIIARKKRLEGYNVLFPMGCDAFGLEAERTAIKEKKLPQEIVKRNITVFKEQLKSIGLSVDWSREISTCDEKYYKWTQWLFLQFYKHGLAEKKVTTINWCPSCGVLANEEIENGTCCQCHSETIQKPKEQWILKMTKYAERLSDDLAQTKYLDYIKTGQINWIGKSKGVQVKFPLANGAGNIEIYTTCIETIYGVTFIVLAPENEKVKELKPYIKNWDEVENYIKQSAKKSEFERSEMVKEKTGCKLEGIEIVNPVNSKKVPVYIGDFVLNSYATGAVMAVPCHDQRDWEFAKDRNIEYIQVIKGQDTTEKAFEKGEYFTNKNAVMQNSGEFDGMTVAEAKEKIAKKLVDEKIAEYKVNFRMRDWIFSRQRYWGEPIPMIKCEKCGWVPVDEKDLPVVLPNVESYEPTKDGESPLSLITDWVNVKCPKCNGNAKRETDTMPGWAGSSWYFMRYCDPNNDKEFASQDALKAWLPVNYYNGGNEHTNRHLLYARFWNKFFYDIGISPVNEPFETRYSQGIVLGSNGVKMSKSLGNVVDPREVEKEYGADALRMWEMFMCDYASTVSWSDEGVKACYRLLNRVVAMKDMIDTSKNGIRDELAYSINFAIKKVTNDIDAVKFNTAVSALMVLVNDVYKVGTVTNEEYRIVLSLFYPFAPHITEEMWTQMNFEPRIDKIEWPKYDESKLVLDEVELAIQINNKIVTKLTFKTDETNENIEKAVREDEKVIEKLNGKEIKKVVIVKGRLVNIIA